MTSRSSTAGTYDGTEFSAATRSRSSPQANDGFELDSNAVTEWNYTAPDSCFEDGDEGPSLVTTTIECGSITFTNTTDESLDVEVYGFDEDVDFEPVDAFTLAGGASHTVETDFADIIFGAFEANDDDFPTQIRVLEVPQDCDGGRRQRQRRRVRSPDDRSGCRHHRALSDTRSTTSRRSPFQGPPVRHTRSRRGHRPRGRAATAYVLTRDDDPAATPHAARSTSPTPQADGSGQRGHQADRRPDPCRHP